MRYINGFIMTVVLGLMCAQFTFAESDPVFGQPLIPDVQELIDEVWPEEERPVAGSILEDEWVNAYAYSGLRHQWSPVWSQDGRYVYSIATYDCIKALWRIEVDTGNPDLVTVFREIYDGYELVVPLTEALGFIHNGSEILVATRVIDEEYCTSVTIKHDDDGNLISARVTNAMPVIIAVDVETGEQRQYLRGSNEAVCSSGGIYLAYYDSERGTVVRNTNTEEEWTVDVSLYHMIFMAGDEYIAYIDNEDGIMYRIPITGGEPELISDHYSLLTMSDISPDGEWVAGTFDAGRRSGKFYDENGEEKGTWGLSVFNKLRLWNSISDESIDPLPFEDNVVSWDALFSPDGTKLCYLREDREQPPGIIETYILDFDPATMKDFPVDVADESPASFPLLGNYPNPFNPTTTIGFTLNEPGLVNLTVYSVTGQAIRELVSEEMAPGRHSVVWDGRDDMGNQVAAGVYISRLVAGGQSVAGRMTLVK